jgi:hypothetical protein
MSAPGRGHRMPSLGLEFRQRGSNEWTRRCYRSFRLGGQLRLRYVGDDLMALCASRVRCFGEDREDGR